ncbi:MAG TPA: hypothetical protein ENM98_04470 [Halothiobacillaceae bacterium]|nr:hypothetical protein [Halothiobacillaceae bacterium]
MKKLTLTVSLLACGITQAAVGGGHCEVIEKEAVIAAQQAWGEGIVAIGAADDPRAAANEHIATLYAYEQGPVLFKPTKAAVEQFRGSHEDALSYFVTGHIEEDSGFALAPYTKVRFENADIITSCDYALAMGNYYFTTTEGEEVKVEFSFGYILDEDDNLRINLHHSSLPYPG